MSNRGTESHGSPWDSRVAEASEVNRIAVAERIGSPVSFFKGVVECLGRIQKQSPGEKGERRC